MNLKTFIAETLSQVLDGIREAQATEVGGNVNAELFGAASGNLISGGTSGMFTRIDFDVALSAETTGSGRGGIKVFGVGAEGQGEHTTGYINRISFSVPVRLPEGDSAPREDYSSVRMARVRSDFDVFTEV